MYPNTRAARSFQVVPISTNWSRFAHVYTFYRQSQPIACIVSIEISRWFLHALFPSFFPRFFHCTAARFHFRVLQPINPLRFFLRESKTWLRRMYRVTLRSSSIISYRAHVLLLVSISSDAYIFIILPYICTHSRNDRKRISWDYI